MSAPGGFEVLHNPNRIPSQLRPRPPNAPSDPRTTPSRRRFWLNPPKDWCSSVSGHTWAGLFTGLGQTLLSRQMRHLSSKLQLEQGIPRFLAQMEAGRLGQPRHGTQQATRRPSTCSASSRHFTQTPTARQPCPLSDHTPIHTLSAPPFRHCSLKHREAGLLGLLRGKIWTASAHSSLSRTTLPPVLAPSTASTHRSWFGVPLPRALPMNRLEGHPLSPAKRPGTRNRIFVISTPSCCYWEMSRRTACGGLETKSMVVSP